MEREAAVGDVVKKIKDFFTLPIEDSSKLNPIDLPKPEVEYHLPKKEHKEPGLAKKIKNFFTFSIDDFIPEKIDMYPGRSPSSDFYESPRDTEKQLKVSPLELPKPPKREPSEEPEEEKEVIPYAFDPFTGTVEVITYEPDYPFPRMGDPKVDHSYMTLSYLLSLGYKYCDWYVDEAHNWDQEVKKRDPYTGLRREEDPCEENLMKRFEIDGILEFAKVHASKVGYDPVSPIFALSHPGCICHLLCIGPEPDEVPDNAPGMPLFGDPDLKEKFKWRIWENINAINFGIIEIHPYTFPPDPDVIAGEVLLEELMGREVMRPEPSKEEEGRLERMHSDHSNAVKSAEVKWVEDIKPIKMIQNLYMRYPIGIVQPVFKDLYGFQVKVNNKLSCVYLLDMNHVVYVPKDSYEILNTTETSEDISAVKRGDYIITENDLEGIVFNVTGKGVQAYIPSLESLAIIDNAKKIEII